MSKKYRSQRIAAAVALSVGLVGFVVTSRARADEWDKLTKLTVNQPIQVQDKVLEPGQYVFKLAESSSNRHIVQIFNSDQSQIIDTILAIPNYRLRPEGNSRFLFYETPPGAARALHAWFYPGDLRRCQEIGCEGAWHRDGQGRTGCSKERRWKENRR